jgi:hypothetical protein
MPGRREGAGAVPVRPPTTLAARTGRRASAPSSSPGSAKLQPASVAPISVCVAVRARVCVQLFPLRPGSLPANLTASAARRGTSVSCGSAYRPMPITTACRPMWKSVADFHGKSKSSKSRKKKAKKAPASLPPHPPHTPLRLRTKPKGNRHQTLSTFSFVVLSRRGFL